MGKVSFPKARFNPTLVRLRQAGEADHDDRNHRFQSHAGSIEAPGKRGRLRRCSQVSIPRWFD